MLNALVINKAEIKVTTFAGILYFLLISITSLLCLLFVNTALYAQPSVGLTINPQAFHYSSNSLFNVPDEFIEKPELTNETTVELNGGFSPDAVNFRYLLNGSNQLSDTRSPQWQSNINEFYVSKSMENWELSIGRRITSWGVGYGFRPLDVIQQYDQQTTSRLSLVGKNQLALEYFGILSSWSLLWVNPRQSDSSQNHQLESITSKYSHSGDNYDLHVLLRYNDKNKLQAGAGGIAIVSDSLSLHASFLASQRYQKSLHTLAGQNDTLLAEDKPFITKNFDVGLQSLVGLNWSTFNKHNIILEYWFDEAAYTHQQWQALFTLAKDQRALLTDPQVPSDAIYGNIAWSASATQAQSLAQHNLMFRWNYNATDWEATVNLLAAIDDKSYVSTITLTTNHRLAKIETGLRTFHGSSDSVYGGLIVDRLLFITLSSEI